MITTDVMGSKPLIFTIEMRKRDLAFMTMCLKNYRFSRKGQPELSIFSPDKVVFSIMVAPGIFLPMDCNTTYFDAEDLAKLYIAGARKRLADAKQELLQWKMDNRKKKQAAVKKQPVTKRSR